MPPKISIVSPVYGCTDCLEAMADSVKAAFDQSPCDWELILVDDRGPDDPWPTIETLAAADDRIRGVQLTRNHGQHLAIWAGMAEASGDWIAVVDCDLQDDPQLIPDLLDKALELSVDAVVVDRGTWADSRLRRLASRAFYGLVGKLAGVRLNNIGNFGLYSRRMVDILLRFKDKEVFLPVMVTLTGLSQASHRVDRSDRQHGESSYSLSTLIRLAVAIVVRFSDRPLKMSVFLGLAFSVLSASVGLFLLGAWSTGAFTVPGWTSLIISVWFLAGLILAVLGVHGIYVGRIFSEVQNRPRILVEKTTRPATRQ